MSVLTSEGNSGRIGVWPRGEENKTHLKNKLEKRAERCLIVKGSLLRFSMHRRACETRPASLLQPGY